MLNINLRNKRNLRKACKFEKFMRLFMKREEKMSSQAQNSNFLFHVINFSANNQIFKNSKGEQINIFLQKFFGL